MITQAKPRRSIATHAACISAGMRDGLRAAQFYARDLSGVDGGKTPRHVTFLSRAVARVARGFDRSMSKAADVSVSIVKPDWRALPSPFEAAVRAEVIEAIRKNEFAYTSQFTAYFFRAARHILERGANAPNLILEHRIEAARRNLEANASLAQILMKLILAAPIARCGAPKAGYDFLKLVDPNISVFATACLALQLAQEGKPLADTHEDEFFEISGALLSPFLEELNNAVTAQDVTALEKILDHVKGLY
jgi:hypothetical protein